jgi:DtxR family Mn-dependent transcriptional regulator
VSSESVEEYLEAIYNFNEKGRPAKNTEIAKRLHVSPPSVTQMIKKLADEGLVEYQPYKGVILTGKGMAMAQKVVRKHRLLERFLHNVLGFSTDKVHNEACRMEHSLSDEAAAALCQVMDVPETCPDDGNPLPPCPLNVEHCDECSVVRSEESDQFRLLTQLAYLKPGEEAKVAFVRGGRRACQRIMDMGLCPGTTVEVVNAAPFHGPIEVKVRGTKLALGRRLAAHVFVALEDKEQESYSYPHPHGPHHRD